MEREREREKVKKEGKDATPGQVDGEGRMVQVQARRGGEECRPAEEKDAVLKAKFGLALALDKNCPGVPYKRDRSKPKPSGFQEWLAADGND